MSLQIVIRDAVVQSLNRDPLLFTFRTEAARLEGIGEGIGVDFLVRADVFAGGAGRVMRRDTIWGVDRPRQKFVCDLPTGRLLTYGEPVRVELRYRKRSTDRAFAIASTPWHPAPPGGPPIAAILVTQLVEKLGELLLREEELRLRLAATSGDLDLALRQIAALEGARAQLQMDYDALLESYEAVAQGGRSGKAFGVVGSAAAVVMAILTGVAVAAPSPGEVLIADVVSELESSAPSIDDLIRLCEARATEVQEVLPNVSRHRE